MNKLILYLVPLVILLSSCSWKPEKEIVTVETIVKPTIAIAQRPRPVEFDELKVKVITEANVQEVIQEMKTNQGQFLVYALDPVTFKNLAIGIEEIKRYIEQQKQIIVYYEEAIKPKQPSVEISEETEKEKSKFLQKIYDKVKPNKKEEVTDGTVQ